MADLEARGLVSSPHTSAGRVPTQPGPAVLRGQPHLGSTPMDPRGIGRILRGTLNPDMTPHQLVQVGIAPALKRVTHMAGLVTVPRPEQLSLQTGRVSEAVGQAGAGDPRGQRAGGAEPGDPHRPGVRRDTELTQAANYINHEFAGEVAAFPSVPVCSTACRTTRICLDSIMQTALEVAAKTFDRVLGGRRRLRGHRGIEPGRIPGRVSKRYATCSTPSRARVASFISSTAAWRPTASSCSSARNPDTGPWTTTA